MNIDDADLTPTERKNLPKDARHLIADAKNDITVPYFSGALRPVDDTLIQRGGGKGLKIYDEIERDTHADAMLQKRKKTLVAREWVVKPASDADIDVKAADIVQAQLAALPFDCICEDLLDATLKGYAVSEVVWERRDGMIAPKDIVSHDQRRFVFDEDWNPRLLTFAAMTDGIELPARKFLVHRRGVKGNNPYGLGLGNKLFWATLFKREGVTFWLHFLEKFAGPTVIAETPYGTLSDEQAKLLRTLQSVRTSSAMTVPVGTNVKFLEAARSGGVSYEAFVAYWDKQISICVTGETLTTDVGKAGSKAASTTHENILEKLVDSDGDLLADTLKIQLVQWIVDYNVPGAKAPSVWRVRPKNEKEEAEVAEAKGKAAATRDDALRKVMETAVLLDNDDDARDYIVASGVVDNLSASTIEALVKGRAGKKDDVGFSVVDAQKKTLTERHVCFSEPDGPVTRISERAIDIAERHFTRRVDAVRALVLFSADYDAMSRGLVELAAKWSPDALATQVMQANELASLEGREMVFVEADEDGADFSDTTFSHEFKEQIEFLKQKRTKPTRAWTDAMYGDHDRAFVVAGATDKAMLADFQAAIIEGAKTYDVKGFAAEFDRIVEKYGWSYNGGRSWRIRTIFETNIRTSFMAGRLRQMRDPDMVKLRPYWQYRHADTRVPLEPRALHLAWDNIVLNWDDPWWDIHFPPNDWLCSCGMRTLSQGQLKRMGKNGPDKAPEVTRQPFMHKASGKTVQQPEGVGYGWDYMPGDKWERGLVPSALIGEGGGFEHTGRHVVQIDTPSPIEDLLATARPFAAQPLSLELSDEEYVAAFLEPFGASIGRAVLWEDKAGERLPISDALFQDRAGNWKVGKRNRATLTPLLAEALIDPDEIWIGVASKFDPVNRDEKELILDRRYIRTDANTGLIVVFEIGRKWWQAITAYPPQKKNGSPDLKTLHNRRGGKLIWKRK